MNPRHLKCEAMKMALLDMITAAYLLSMVVLPFWTNLRPIYINHWNKTKSLCIGRSNDSLVLEPPQTLFKLNKTEYLKNTKNDTETDLDNVDILMAANQAVVAVFGTFSKYF